MTELVEQYNDPWNRLEDESPADYAAFVEYCKMGPRRTPRALAAHLGMATTSIQKIARKNDWVKRSEHYDIACSRLVPENQNLNFEETLAFQHAVGTIMLDIGIKAIELKSPGSIKTADAIKLLKEGSEIQRRAMGITDSISININQDAFENVNKLIDDIIEITEVDEDESGQ